MGIVKAALQLAKPKAIGSPADTNWLTIKEVMGFERISRRECYNRLRPCDKNYLLSKKRSEGDGKPGRLIYVPSMSFEAQERWRKHALEAIANPKPAADVPAEHGQLNLLPRTKIDNEIAALSLLASQRDVVIQRFRIVQPLMNHDWKALGYPTRGACRKAFAAANHISSRTILRWEAAYRESENLLDLADEKPGPERGKGTLLDASMRAFLRDCWVIKKLTRKQSYEKLKCYLETKQKGCGVAHEYHIPSYPTVSRFMGSLSSLDKAARKGPEALKSACGHIDRTYRDLHSLDVVETDEWKCDFLVYNPRRPKIVRRWWLLTFYDRRSMYPLVGKLVAGSDHDKRHGIQESDEIEILVTLLKEYGTPKEIYSDHGRFRGKTFGGREKFDGILNRLGIRKGEPREKNPRGSRLERFHRFLADQSRTVPGWIGANDKERKMTPGDAQAELHKRWVAGDPEVPRTPLLSITEAMQQIDGWMNTWRDHESEGTDMDGLSPRAVFTHNIPEGGFRKLSKEQIAWETAQQFDELIEAGGIIQLRDGTRYSHPALIAIQGERRQVVRLRDDHSKISVLPAAKGEEVIIAPRRECVGMHEPDHLARQMELQMRLRKLAAKMVEPLELESHPGLPIPVQNVKPRDFADLEY